MREKKNFQTVDEYIKTFPENVQIILENIRQTIRKVAPEAAEAISYGIPTLPSAAQSFKKELSEYKQGKGSVQFPLDKPIPYDLVKKIVIFRVRESLSPS